MKELFKRVKRFDGIKRLFVALSFGMVPTEEEEEPPRILMETQCRCLVILFNRYLRNATKKKVFSFKSFDYFFM